MMNFLKDWIIQYQNKFSVGGVETTIDRVTGTVSQEGDKIMASYFNEIQKNCVYSVNATRVVEGVLEIYDITIDGSEEFTPFNQTFLIDFSETNTQVDSLLRFNGITYSLRFSDSIPNGDNAPKLGFIPKRALVKLDVANSKAIIVDFNPNNFVSPAFIGIPTAPTPAIGTDTTQIATAAYVNDMVGGTGAPAISKAANGYVKMANGLILQWGADSRAYNTITFPLAFPTACLQVVAAADYADPWGFSLVSAKTAANFTVGRARANGTIWFAVGY